MIMYMYMCVKCVCMYIIYVYCYIFTFYIVSMNEWKFHVILRGKGRVGKWAGCRGGREGIYVSLCIILGRLGFGG